jgi:hypothetical protein
MYAFSCFNAVLLVRLLYWFNARLLYTRGSYQYNVRINLLCIEPVQNAFMNVRSADVVWVSQQTLSINVIVWLVNCASIYTLFSAVKLSTSL